MLFNSLAFFVFFPITVLAFFATTPRHRWITLLGASWLFYAWWKTEYVILLIGSTCVDFTVGRALGRTRDARRRTLILLVTVSLNVGILLLFKYVDFFGEIASRIFAALGLPYRHHRLDLVLPVGISFYTFQTIGYAVDVYRRKIEPETHLGRFALFLAFFPHLVAGPIMRASVLMPQFRERQRWDFDRAARGLGWMLWGLFKKVVIADRAAVIVNAVYGDPDSFQGATILVATYAFAFQIFGDFSGYSDIAFGAAKVLGFDLVQNFHRPYWSSTLSEFWRRWHTSLSTWFVDYVYVPLGGNQGGMPRRIRNIAVVFLLSGLWHGASFTFVLWGLYHGALVALTYAIGTVWKSKVPKLLRWLGTLLTFHLVCLGWLLFRARDLAHAGQLLARLPTSFPVSVLHELTHAGAEPPVARAVDLVILAASIVIMELGELCVHEKRTLPLPPLVRQLAWAALCVWVVLTAVQSHSPFLYFQF